MKKTKLAALVLTAGSLLASPVMAEVSLNAGVVSNYLWRGVTQTDGAAAVQGGVDYGHESGVYVGTWASNVGLWGTLDEMGFSSGNGYELDFYGGYANEVGAFSYDVGVIYYAYPAAEELNFTEVYVSLGYEFVSVGYSKQVQSDWDANESSYLQADASFDVADKLSLGLHVGKWIGSDSPYGEEVDVNASLTKSSDYGDISFLISKSNVEGYDDVQTVAGYSVSF